MCLLLQTKFAAFARLAEWHSLRSIGNDDKFRQLRDQAVNSVPQVISGNVVSSARDAMNTTAAARTTTAAAAAEQRKQPPPLPPV